MLYADFLVFKFQCDADILLLFLNNLIVIVTDRERKSVSLILGGSSF